MGSNTGSEDERRRRLADELRANLQRRKAQARSRRAGSADDRPEGLRTGRDGAGSDEAGSDGADEPR